MVDWKTPQDDSYREADDDGRVTSTSTMSI